LHALRQTFDFEKKMVVADANNDYKYGDDTMTHALQQSLVVLLDETCREQHFTKHSPQQNGIAKATDEVHGILSMADIDLLLTIFDRGLSTFHVLGLKVLVITTPSSTDCLSILAPELSSSMPPPTVFLVPISPALLSPPCTPPVVHNFPSDTTSRSSRSSTSLKKHPQSNSSDKPLSYGPEFLQILQHSPHGAAHIIPVAVSRRSEQWSKDNLLRLSDLGFRDILSVPCEHANVGGLYMVCILQRVAYSSI
jgi:hypothetical protein